MLKTRSVCIVSRISGLREAFIARGLDVASFRWIEPANLETEQAALAEAEIIVGEPAAIGPLVDTRAPRLQWFQSTWAGCNQLLSASRRDYVATRLAGTFGPDMAEYAAMHVLTLERQFVEERARQQRCEWRDVRGDPEQPTRYRRMPTLTLGVLGLGDIGMCVARTFASGFGMRVVGCRQRPALGAAEGIAHVYGLDGLGEFLAECDYIVSVLPSTPQTRGLLDGEALAACAARRATLINVGRGDLLTEATICGALERGWLRHYVGDVFATEPLPAASPLWHHPQVTVSPHVSAVSFPDDVAAAFKENLRRLEEGGLAQLQHVFDWERGY